MKTKNLTIVAIVTVVAIVGLLNTANAVPGAGRSGNPPGVEPATTLQSLVNCCQSKATIAEYQDKTATNQVMGTCAKNGIETFRTGGLPALQGYINSTCGGACKTNADCDDGNSCTSDVCSTGLRPGCIHGIPLEPTSCQINGQVGVCEGATCVPSEETCITRTACAEKGEEGWSVQPIAKELCESEFACGIAATYECLCSSE
ncbi:MAG: hypothetical protein Q8N65_01720 [bacterium]|nr:hypothetical protein [bacterium]